MTISTASPVPTSPPWEFCLLWRHSRLGIASASAPSSRCSCRATRTRFSLSSTFDAVENRNQFPNPIGRLDPGFDPAPFADGHRLGGQVDLTCGDEGLRDQAH